MIVSAMLVLVGVIHLLPLSGVLGPDRLAALYGLDFSEPNLALLMRHRAVLFGILGTFFVVAAVRPVWQPLALGTGFVSVVSFLWLAWSIGGHNALIGRVVLADWIALVALVIGSVAWAQARRTTA